MESKLAPPRGVTSFIWAYIGKTLKSFWYLAIGPRATEFDTYLYQAVVYQECPNYRPGVKFGQVPEVSSFIWANIGKNLKSFWYLAIGPRAAKFGIYLYQVAVYQECLNYSPGVKFGLAPGVTSFIWAYIGKTLKIVLLLTIIKTRATKFSPVSRVSYFTGPFIEKSLKIFLFITKHSRPVLFVWGFILWTSTRIQVIIALRSLR